jgi:hypothetical protein
MYFSNYFPESTTEWQLEMNDVKARLAHLRASGDFSDCVLMVGSDDNVEVCTVYTCHILICCHILVILSMSEKNFG